MQRYEVRVVDARRVTPRMIRLRLTGADLRMWASTGRPDEYCQVFVPAAGGPVTRLYTVRRHDAVTGSVDIDVVDHRGGVAAHWARRAGPGDRLAIGPAAAGDGPGPDRTRLHLIGDATALPAIGRTVEELGAGVTVLVTVAVKDRAEEQTWRTAADTRVTWTHVPDLRDVPAALLGAVRALPTLGPTDHVWMAGEASAARAARRYLRHDRGLSGPSFLAMGYWRSDAEHWEARYRDLADAVQRRIDRAVRDLGADTDALYDAIDAIYDESGL